jgi:hypothetical protein
VVALEVATKAKPWFELYADGKSVEEVAGEIKEKVLSEERPELWAHGNLTTELKGLIEQCWCQDPDDRLTIMLVVDALENNGTTRERELQYAFECLQALYDSKLEQATEEKRVLKEAAALVLSGVEAENRALTNRASSLQDEMVALKNVVSDLTVARESAEARASAAETHLAQLEDAVAEAKRGQSEAAREATATLAQQTHAVSLLETEVTTLRAAVAAAEAEAAKLQSMVETLQSSQVLCHPVGSFSPTVADPTATIPTAADPRPTTPLMPASTPQNGWICGVCTFNNKPKAIVCDICDTSRPGEESTPSTAGQAPPGFHLGAGITEPTASLLSTPTTAPPFAAAPAASAAEQPTVLASTPAGTPLAKAPAFSLDVTVASAAKSPANAPLKRVGGGIRKRFESLKVKKCEAANRAKVQNGVLLERLAELTTRNNALRKERSASAATTGFSDSGADAGVAFREGESAITGKSKSVCFELARPDKGPMKFAMASVDFAKAARRFRKHAAKLKKLRYGGREVCRTEGGWQLEFTRGPRLEMDDGVLRLRYLDDSGAPEDGPGVRIVDLCNQRDVESLHERRGLRYEDVRGSKTAKPSRELHLAGRSTVSPPPPPRR